MKKTNFLSALDYRFTGNRFLNPLKQALFEFSEKVDYNPINLVEEVRFDIRLGCCFNIPLEDLARDREGVVEFYKSKAGDMFAQEVYGEVEAKLRELEKLMLYDGVRHNSKSLEKITEIREMIRYE